MHIYIFIYIYVYVYAYIYFYILMKTNNIWRTNSFKLQIPLHCSKSYEPCFITWLQKTGTFYCVI